MMRHLTFMEIAMALSVCIMANANNVHVRSLSVAEIQNAQYVIHRIDFSDGLISLIGSDGNVLAADSVSRVRGFSFIQSQTPTTVTEPTDWQVRVRKGVIQIDGMDDAVLRLYSMDGKLLIGMYGSQMDVSGVPVGVYLLQANGEMMKVVIKR